MYGLYTLLSVVLVLWVIWLIAKNYRLKKQKTRIAHEFDDTSFILENLNDGLIELDTDLTIMRVNKTTENILGVEATEIVKRRIERNKTSTDLDKMLADILLPPDSVTKVQLRNPDTLGGTVYTHDVKISFPEERKVRIFTIPKTDRKTKRLIGYVKIVRDVSIEDVVEKHKSDIVSIVSHQLLTPLTGVKWILDGILAGDMSVFSDKQITDLRKGLSANESMIELVNDLLDITKVEQSKFNYMFKKADIVAFLIETIGDIKSKADAKSITLVPRYHAEKELVVFDHDRLKIALTNLIDNAINYSPAGKEVSIGTELKGPTIEISVTDRGIGIPDKDKEHLFSKFYRANNAKEIRQDGTGLGLYLAKHVAEDHGGEIRVLSKEGEGSTFILVLPTRGQPPPKESSDTPA